VNSKSLTSLLKFIVFTGIGVLVVYLVFRNINFEKFFEGLKQAHLFWIVVAMLTGIAGHWIRAARWSLLLSSMGYRAPIYPGFLSVISGYFINLAIPRAGELSRCTLMSSVTGIPVQKLIGTVVTERILDLVMTALIVLLVLSLQFDILFGFTTELLAPLITKISSLSNNTFFYPVLFLFFLLGIGAILFLQRQQKLHKQHNKNASSQNRIVLFLIGIWEGVKSIFSLHKPFLFILETLAIWVSYLLSTYFILKAFPFTEAEGLLTSLSVLLFSTIGVIVPAPGGIGSVITTQNGLMEIYQYPMEEATLFAFVLFFTQVVGFILLGTFAMIHLSIMKKSKNATSGI
jgi:uncharacterized protein (TIRG00374 family)